MDGSSPAPIAATLRANPPAAPACRRCGAPLHETFADPGLTALADSCVAPTDAAQMEPLYPLHAMVCSDCRLVQPAEFQRPQAIFSEYVPILSWPFCEEITAQMAATRDWGGRFVVPMPRIEIF